jgi:cytochrome c oxidase subunit 1
MPFFYLAWSLVYGQASPANPWNATGLEWRTTSPPPTHNFVTTPVVNEEPYDYHDVRTGPEAETRDVDAVRARRGVTPRPGGISP